MKLDGEMNFYCSGVCASVLLVTQIVRASLVWLLSMCRSSVLGRYSNSVHLCELRALLPLTIK